MIEYQKASIDDTARLIDARMAFLRELKHITPDEEKTMRPAYADFLREVLADGSFVQWLALDNGRIIGTGSVSFYRLPPNLGAPNGKTAYIANMYTDPAYRKQGIARKLFSLTVEEAKNRGCQKISLNATDMGRPLYTKLGFTDTVNEMVWHSHAER